MTENKLADYPKVYNIGHKELESFFDAPVTVEEKIDGSQFSFGKINGELIVRSKGRHIDVHNPDKMFFAACNTVLLLSDKLLPEATYRAEYLQKPKHNTLAYNRVPENHLIIFDIDTANQCYMSHYAKGVEAERLGLEVVPHFFSGRISSFDEVRHHMGTESCLGGQLVEGIVIKNYFQYGKDNKVLMAKYVSEAFKELHKPVRNVKNPHSKDIKASIIDSLHTQARWVKGVQRLRESGELTDSPQDIGPLMKSISMDIKEECEELIGAQLFEWAWRDICKGALRGFQQWYKDELAKKQFEGSTTGTTETK